MARLSLTLLGGLHVRVDPGGTVALPTRKSQALLAYLALPPGQPHPRDKLATLLWGGIRDESARASLRQALFAVRRALADTGALRQEADTLALDAAAVTVDVAAFEQAIKEGTPEALERAAVLYRGDLLDGLVVDEAPFEEWLLGERERLREVALEGLTRLLAQQRRAGATETAIGTARRLLTLDPLQEAVHRALMRLYADLGRRGAALRQYQHCVSVLGRELGVEPEPETKHLYQELLRQRSVRPAPAAAPASPREARAEEDRAPGVGAETPLIGRVNEHGALCEALEAAIAGSGRIVAVLGEAGIGKSRLVAELAAEAAARGMSVVVGRAYESEQILPFGPWVDALRAAHVANDSEALERLAPVLRAELARLLPEVGGASTAGVSDIRLLFESIAELIAHLASRDPLLLVLEDLHWADELSTRLVAFLGRRLADKPVLLVATARDDEEGPALRQALDDLGRAGTLRTLTLHALSRPDTLALVREIARSGDEAAAERLGTQAWTASEGNPFVAVETVRAHAQGAAIAPGGDLALPERVREIITKRLERLSERGQMLTAVAAVIGRELDFALLQRAGGLGEEETAAGIEELVRRRILHGVGERFDFSHDRIREAAYGRLLAVRRRLLHRRAAEAIEALYAGELPRHALALGRHYREAEVWESAVVHLRRAGFDAFARTANREALACFESALTAIDRLDDGPLRTEYAIDVRISIDVAFMNLGEFRQGLARLAEAEVVARAADDQKRLGRILYRTAYDLSSLGEFSAALARADVALAMATAANDRPGLIGVNVMIARILYGRGDYRRVIETGWSNVQLVAAETREPPSTASRSAVMTNLTFSHFWIVLALAELGAFQEGAAVGAAALRSAREQGRMSEVVTQLSLGRLYVVQGALTPAIEVLEQALPLCEVGSDLAVYFSRTASSLGEAYVRSGRMADGLRLLERADTHAEAIAFVYGQALFAGTLGEARLLAGDVDGAQADAERALMLARRYGQRGWEAWALRLLGEIAPRRPAFNLAAAQAHFAEAAALAEERGMRPLLAHCRLGLGRAYRRAGDDARAQAAIEEALAEYRALEMPYWTALAEADRD